MVIGMLPERAVDEIEPTTVGEAKLPLASDISMVKVFPGLKVPVPVYATEPAAVVVQVTPKGEPPTAPVLSVAPPPPHDVDPLKVKSLTLKVPPEPEAPHPYSLKEIAPLTPWNAGADRSIVVPVAVGVPMLAVKPSTLLLNSKLVGPVPDACPVYTKLVKLMLHVAFGVKVNSKYAFGSNEPVSQPLALYLLLALLPLIPVPRPIPLTEILESKLCPVVYGFAVFGFVPVIGFVQSCEKLIADTSKNEINKVVLVSMYFALLVCL